MCPTVPISRLASPRLLADTRVIVSRPCLFLRGLSLPVLAGSLAQGAEARPASHTRTKSGDSSPDLEAGQASDKSQKGGFLDDFFKQVATIKSDIASITRQLLRLKDIHKQLKFQAQVEEIKELRDEMQADIDVVSKTAKAVRCPTTTLSLSLSLSLPLTSLARPLRFPPPPRPPFAALWLRPSV